MKRKKEVKKFLPRDTKLNARFNLSIELDENSFQVAHLQRRKNEEYKP